MRQLLVLVALLGACTPEGTQGRTDANLESGTLGRSSGRVPDAGAALDTLPAQMALDSSAAPLLDGAPVVVPDALIASDTSRDAILVLGDARRGDVLLGDADSTPTTCAEVNAWCGRCVKNCWDFKPIDNLPLKDLVTPFAVEQRGTKDANCTIWYREAVKLYACY